VHTKHEITRYKTTVWLPFTTSGQETGGGSILTTPEPSWILAEERQIGQRVINYISILQLRCGS